VIIEGKSKLKMKEKNDKTLGVEKEGFGVEWHMI